jgi:hypothetical protein
LDNLQWVRRTEDGWYVGIDFANRWDEENRIIWQNRPTLYQLRSGERAKLTKIAENHWTFETEEGIPWYV